MEKNINDAVQRIIDVTNELRTRQNQIEATNRLLLNRVDILESQIKAQNADRTYFTKD
jgi:hypothetical protein